MNFMLFLPEFLITGAAFGVLGIDLFLSRERKVYLPWLTLAGLAAEAMVVLEAPAAAKVEPWLPFLPQKLESS